MKKIITCFLVLLSSLAISQTTISTSSVSGTWTLSGSPYIVTVQTTVLSGQTLTIQPGVTVRFQATTKLTVVGQLIASGTGVAPIVFEADDTTNWSNQTTTAGGWSGLQIQQYSGSGPDNSILDYCTIKDVKFGYAAYANYLNALTCERSLKILNCTFIHNNNGTGTNWSDAVIYIYTYSATDTVEINNCTVKNNISLNGILCVNGAYGYTKILNSNFDTNYNGSNIWTIACNVLMQGNLIHDNTMDGDNASVKITGGEVFFRFNKVYRNTCVQLAAIGCRAGKVTIENNLICNNVQTDASCGAASGGGGIHLAHNDGSPFLDTYYIVRNNIIANNYSAYGGGGIYVFQGRATISNNHIINNLTYSYGKAVLVLSTLSEVNLKNNIIFSKSASGIVDTTNIVYMLSGNTLQMDYNYLPASYTKCVQTAFGFTLVGDTLNNVIGNNPGMIAPTADNLNTTSALLANFDLLSSSPCINQGDTAGVFASTIDYDGSPRIVTTIDIGAYEYGAPEGINEQDVLSNISIYPNPATHYFTIAIESNTKKAELIIFDVTGKIVLQTDASLEEKIKVDASSFSKGLYFVQVKTDGFVVTKKLVVK